MVDDIFSEDPLGIYGLDGGVWYAVASVEIHLANPRPAQFSTPED